MTTNVVVVGVVVTSVVVTCVEVAGLLLADSPIVVILVGTSVSMTREDKPSVVVVVVATVVDARSLITLLVLTRADVSDVIVTFILLVGISDITGVSVTP